MLLPHNYAYYYSSHLNSQTDVGVKAKAALKQLLCTKFSADIRNELILFPCPHLHTDDSFFTSISQVPENHFVRSWFSAVRRYINMIINSSLLLLFNGQLDDHSHLVQNTPIQRMQLKTNTT